MKQAIFLLVMAFATSCLAQDMASETNSPSLEAIQQHLDKGETVLVGLLEEDKWSGQITSLQQEGQNITLKLAVDGAHIIFTGHKDDCGGVGGGFVVNAEGKKVEEGTWFSRSDNLTIAGIVQDEVEPYAFGLVFERG